MKYREQEERCGFWAKVIFSCSVICIFTLVLSASAFAQKKRISIGGSQSGGTQYLLSVGMADVINRFLPGYNAVALETGGNVENPRLIGKGEIEIGCSDLRAASQGYLGAPPFTAPIKTLRIGFFIQHSVLQVVALEKSGIKTIADLKGKVVSFGAPGSLVGPDLEALLRLHGLTIKDVRVRRLGPSEAMEALADGLIDAGGVYGALPSPAITSVAVKQNIRVIPVDEKLLKSAESKEYILAYPIPAGTYKGQDEKIFAWTVASGTFFDERTSTDDVYKWTKAIMEHKDVLQKLHPVGKGVRLYSKEEAKVSPVPLHPGVLKYAAEVGMKY